MRVFETTVYVPTGPTALADQVRSSLTPLFNPVRAVIRTAVWQISTVGVILWHGLATPTQAQ
jgi:hypothetical protein